MRRSKTCPKCKIEKPLDGFDKNKSKKDGFDSHCKACRKEHYEQNKAAKLAKQKEYREQNKAEIAARQKEYYEQNKAAILAQKKEYKKNRLEEDPFFRLTHNTRSLIKLSIQRKGYPKKSRTQQILGCSFSQFKEHLHNNPYGFTIDMDGLDLDHIIPLSTAQSEKHLLELNHYTNLQLLPSEYNRNIKKDNPWDKEDFENWYWSLFQKEVLEFLLPLWL